MLSKKIHSISYHFCQEAIAAGIVCIAKEDTATNLTDFFTKIFCQGFEGINYLIDLFMKLAISEFFITDVVFFHG